MSVEGLGFHRKVGKRNRLLDPVVGLSRASVSVGSHIIHEKRTTHLDRTQEGDRDVHRPGLHDENGSCGGNLNVGDIRNP